MKRIGLVATVFIVISLTCYTSAKEKAARRLSVIVRGEAPSVVKAGSPIPVKITITNGLDWPIYFDTYSLMLNDWNGETVNIGLVDIYRNESTNRFLARPKVTPPRKISGLGAHRIEPGKSLTIRTDARKWKLRDGWLPGKYRVIVAVKNLRIDNYSTLRVVSESFEFEIQMK